MEKHLKFSPGEQRKFLQQVSKISGLTHKKLSVSLGINYNTYRGWVSERYSITLAAALKLEGHYKVRLFENHTVLVSRWDEIKSNAGKIGGNSCFKKHGSFGTAEGRSKGGTKALKIMREKGIIPLAKPFIEPQGYSEKLAEMVGILLGDGGITKGQCTTTLNKTDDREYALFVASLGQKLFHQKPGIYPRKTSNAVVVCFTGVNLVKYLTKIGLKIGNKVRQQVDIPTWIKKSKKFSRACVRGIFDTDGCAYLDRHKINGRKYAHFNIAITNYSHPLLSSVNKILCDEGFCPTKSSHRSNRSVRIRQLEHVKDFFDKIGSSNPKHQNKFRAFLEEYPSGRTGTVSKTVGVCKDSRGFESHLLR